MHIIFFNKMVTVCRKEIPVTQMSNYPKLPVLLAVYILTDTVTHLASCWLNFIFRVTCSGNHVQVTQMGTIPDSLCSV